MARPRVVRPRASARATRPSAPSRTRLGRTHLHARALRVGDREVPLYSGAVHYWRLERDAWRRALSELARLGVPMVDTYVPWGVHELGPGEFDFGRRDPRKDLGAFLDLAREVGLLVLLRPGPHVNAELTWFGLPERICYDPHCQARSPSGNPVILPFPPVMFPVPSYASARFHQEVGAWYDAVAEVVRPRLYPDGPVALLQIDNEAAYYFRDGAYDQDYHPDALASWRTFLAKRYGTVAELARAHGLPEVPASFDEAPAPTRFDGRAPGDLVRHLDWAEHKERMVCDALARMRARMERAGLSGVPVIHNLPLGDGGLPVSVPTLEGTVDLVGFDYYHGRREHRTIRRRTLYLAGTTDFPYAPELGVGAPPWFTPLAHDDSLYCALVALAYGLRGFNLYMAVDRDRWYGAPIDASGTPRAEAEVWRTLVRRLAEVGFHRLQRRAEVALVVPREYQRLSRATSLLGTLSPSILEAIGGTPVDACREDDLGFAGPVQVLWWRMLARFADALVAAGIPYVYVDSESLETRLEGRRVAISPSYEYASEARWRALCHFARQGGTVVYGPTIPGLDERMRRHPFEVPRRGRRVLVDTPEDAVRIVAELSAQLDLAYPFRARPAPVETTVHEGPQGEPRVLFVINPGDRPVEALVALPGAMRFVDALSGAAFSGETSLSVPLAARSARMLVVEGADATPTRVARVPRPSAGRARARGNAA
jgi:beta-galactosidase